MIELEKQVATQRCEACDVDFTVVRGSVVDDGHPFGGYLVALHGHSPEGRLAHVVIGLLDRREPEAAPIAVALEVSGTASEFHHTIIDWAELPLTGETYLGRRLDRAEVLANPLKPVVLQVADRVLHELSEVQSYFA